MIGFNDIVEGYLAERRSVGFKMEKAESSMVRIAKMHSNMGCPPDVLPKELADAWVARKVGEAESTRLNRVSQIRCLATYMVRMGYEAYVIPGRQGYAERGSYDPYIFTDDELHRLFVAADTLAGPDPASRQTQIALILRLLYSTGMRCGEACSLKKSDVDFSSGMVTVRHAKNDKDRFVPVHPSVVARMASFSNAANLRHPQYPTHERFWSLPEGKPLTTSAVYSFFRRALWKAGISHGGRGKGPRVHDLRFTFACHRLRKWVREGADINALLPVLSAYMGHADTRCTEYYLRLTAELYPGMVSQVEQNCEWMVPSWSSETSPVM